ncbi:lipocalin-like domain-containing protein [Yersinia entomophaga]|nr:lipocalin-like domain-containing protein [Yersinia entomophaga]
MLQDGSVSFPMGEKVSGRIHYKKNGTMAAQLYTTERRDFASLDWLEGSDAEMKSAFESALCYFGRYQINEEKQSITHIVEGGLFPNWVGTQMVRYYEFEKDRLILRTPTMPMNNIGQVGVLIWAKIF